MISTPLPYWSLSGFYFLFFMVVGGLLPYWPLYLESLHFDPKQIGTLSAVIVITKILSTYLWGWITDYTKQRSRVIRLTSCIAAISFIAVIYSQTYWLLIITLFIFSLFWSAALPQVDATTLSALGNETRYYTKIRVWGSVGFIVSVLILGRLFEIISIKQLPLILLTIMLALWWTTWQIPDFKPPPTAITHKPVLSPSILVLLIVCFLMQASHGGYYTFFTLLLKHNQYSSTYIGALWAIGVIAEIAIFIIMHRLIHSFGLKKLMLASLLFASTRWLLLSYFITSLPVVILAQTFHAFSFGVYHAVAIQYIHREFRDNLQGRGQALYSSVSFGAGLALGSWISGYIWVHSTSMVFLFATLLSLTAFCIAWLWLK